MDRITSICSIVLALTIGFGALPGPPFVEKLCVGPGETDPNGDPLSNGDVSISNTTDMGTDDICVTPKESAAGTDPNSVITADSNVTGDITGLDSGDTVSVGNNSTVNVTGSGGTVTFNALSSHGLVTATTGPITVVTPSGPPVTVPAGTSQAF